MTGTEQSYLHSIVQRQLSGTCCTLFYLHVASDPKATEAKKDFLKSLRHPESALRHIVWSQRWTVTIWK